MKIELSHDLVAAEVFSRFSEEEKALRRASRMLKEAFEFHQDQIKEQKEGRLLSPSEIAYIFQFLDLLKTTPNISEYIDQSLAALKEKEEAERRRLEEEIKTQKELRIRQQRFLRMSISAGIVLLVLSVFVVFLYRSSEEQKDELEIKNEELTLKRDSIKQASDSIKIARYGTHLAKGKERMAAILYVEAINEFNIALAFDSTSQEARDSLLICQQRLENKTEYERLMNEGERLLNQGDNLNARNRFHQALALGFNTIDPVNNINIASSRLERDYIRYIEEGDKFFAAKGFAFALKRYQKALQINSGDEKLKEKIEEAKKHLPK